MKYEIVVHGNPIGKKRPRFARRGKFVTTYNDQETEEGRFILDVRQQFRQPLIETPIHLTLVYEMPIPKSASNKQHTLMAEGNIQHTKKPDLDNLIKFTKDCLNNTVWKDDAQVIAIMARKKYSEEPKTVIIISIGHGYYGF